MNESQPERWREEEIPFLVAHTTLEAISDSEVGAIAVALSLLLPYDDRRGNWQGSPVNQQRYWGTI
jgi:hypothetical protein